MAMNMRVRVLADFAALRDALPALASPSPDADPFCTLEWYENLARTGFDPAAQLHLLAVEDTLNQTCFCLPLASRMRSADFGADALVGLSNYYSGLYGPIGDVSLLSAEDWRTICRQLRARSRQWPIINLQPLDTATPFFQRLLAALAGEGYWTDTYFCFGNWYLELAGRSFDDYFRDLPALLQNTIVRGRKKLERAGDWGIDIHDAPGAALERAIADFESVYRQSWKRPEPFPEFIPGLCRMAAARGWLRLGVLRFHGRPIATQLWLVKDGRAMIYKLAYDKGHPHLSPGSVLSAALMRHVIDIDRVREVDYLTGDDAYKRDWMPHRRERLGIVAFDPGTLTGLSAGLRHFAGKFGRRLLAAMRNNSTVTRSAIG